MTGIRVSAVTTYTTHREWASRPSDERAGRTIRFDRAASRLLTTAHQPWSGSRAHIPADPFTPTVATRTA